MSVTEDARPEVRRASAQPRVPHPADPRPVPRSPQPTPRAALLPYRPALDGLRAVAVLAVLLYHAGPPFLPGGFLGVEVFFVLSGYLITALLAAEWRQRGGIDLAAFWIRRARRLLPALGCVLLATIGIAAMFLPQELSRLRGDAIAAVTYLTNWRLVSAQESYFETIGRPSLLRHLWSLAVEEQFYLIWPPICAIALRRWPVRRVGLATLAAALLSAGLMAVLFSPGQDPSRLYYGTDTRAAGFLIGSALALLWAPGRVPAGPGAGWGRWTDAIGLFALGVLGVGLWRLDEANAILYRGGFFLTAISAGAVIGCAVHPGARWLPAALGWGPLRWLGVRSYGIYLWYWPVYALTRPEVDVPLNDGLPLLLLRLPLIVGLAALSYRYVEQPARAGALGPVCRTLAALAGGRRGRILVPATGCVAAAAVAWLGSELALAQPSAPPAYLAEPARRPIVASSRSAAGSRETAAESALDSPPTSPNPLRAASQPALSARGSVDPNPLRPDYPPAPGATEPAGGNLPAAGDADVRPPTGPDPGIVAVGDSVLLGAAAALEQTLDGIDVEADQGLQIAQVTQVLQARREAGRLGRVMILHIGHNGPIEARQLDAIMTILENVPRVVFLTVKVPRRWEAANNQVIAEGVARYPKAELLDWRSFAAGRPDLFWDDRTHLRPEGAAAYADLIRRTLAQPRA